MKRWIAFLRNHKDGIAAMDFFTVPTASLRVVYVLFVIGHARREIVHFNVTFHPTSGGASTDNLEKPVRVLDKQREPRLGSVLTRSRPAIAPSRM